MKTYDAILVLGRGIREDGSIPDSAKATVKKAVELYNLGVSKHIIFSGKWSYTSKVPFPTTESEAMAKYAKELGLPNEAIILETQSDTTITNIYYVKTKTLQPNSWRKVLLVTLDPIYNRAFWLLKKFLGPGYECDYEIADFSFSEQKQQELQLSEKQKLEKVKLDCADVRDGDHETLFKRERDYLKGRGLI